MERTHTPVNLVRQDRSVQIILFLGLVIQIITAITAVGAYHPDQHFAVVEYGMRFLGLPSSAEVLWDFEEKMLPSLKMFLFMGYYKLVTFLGMEDHYHILTLLRLVCGLSTSLLFNFIILKFLRPFDTRILYVCLGILNFSWWFPFIRASYSAEILSSLFFFGAMTLYLIWQEKKPLSIGKGLLIGFIMSLAFFARFQIGFAGIGFLVWFFWTQKGIWKTLGWMGLGFSIGFVLNTYLDSLYYEEFVSTPVNYFRVNIVEGKAADFGTEPVTFYLAILAAVLTAPLLSILLLGTAAWGMWKRIRDPFVLATIFFLLAHFAVSHKEDRFLFPIFGVLPLLVGYGLAGFLIGYSSWAKAWKWVLGGVVIFSLLLNTFALGFFMLTPYSQGIHFMQLMDRQFAEQQESITIYCHRRNPFQSSSRIPLEWYYAVFNPKVEFVTRDSLNQIFELASGEGEFYLASTYNQLRNDSSREALEARMEPVKYSSKTIWRVNEWLEQQGINTINEIWVLYRVRPID